MKNSNNPYDRADSYRVAVTPRKQAIINVEGMEQTDKIPPTVKRWWWCICPGLNPIPTQDIEMLKTEVEWDEHLIDIQDLYLKLGTDPKKGFTDAKALELLARDGSNTISQPVEIPNCIKYFRHINNSFAAIIGLTAILCFIAYGLQVYFFYHVPLENLFVGFFLVLLIVATAILLHFQLTTNSQLLSAFMKLLPQRATVLRAGTKREISCEELVVGDIVEIRAGNIVPADMRIIDSDALKIDASNLNGRSEAIVKSHTCYNALDVLQSPNLVHAGTVVLEGAARAAIIATGDKTVLGRMAALSSMINPLDSPFREEVLELVRRVIGMSVLLGFVFFVVALVLPSTWGFTWLDTLLAVIPIIVACVPIGIYVVITAGFYLIAKRLSHRNFQVKKLEAIETLGATSTLILDASGLLTDKEVQISHFWYDNNIWKAEMQGEDPKGFLSNPDVNSEKRLSVHVKNETWSILSRVAVSCNRARFMHSKNGSENESFGSQIDSALLKYVEQIEGDTNKIREIHKMIADIPTIAGKNYQISVHYVQQNKGAATGTGRHHVYIKGDPYAIVDMCNTICIEGRSLAMEEGLKLACFKACQTLAKDQGSTIVALADIKLSHHKFGPGYPFQSYLAPQTEGSDEPHVAFNFPVTGFRLVGLVSVVAPIRNGIPQAIDMCKSAGIRVLMVTPESASNAKIMAKNMGILSDTNETIEDIADRLNVTLEKVDPRDADACVVEGKELRDMTYSDIDEVLRFHSEIVFAATSPAQKLMIVESCQRLGDVVALTGSHTTDAASMRRADVGIALQSSHDVCKEAADMILMEDDIFTLLNGIEEGRLYYNNLKKSLSYIMTSNVPELLPLMVYVLASVPLPIGVITMLCIDLGTDIAPSISLFYEKSEDSIMKRRPRDLYESRLFNERLFKKSCGIHGVIQFLAGAFMYFVIMGENGFWPAKLLGQRLYWNAIAINDLQDSYGQEWTYMDRKNLEYACFAGFLWTVVITQCANLIVCRTRINSIFQQGMRNWILNLSLLGQTVLALFLIYVPGLNFILRFYPLKFWWLLIPVPYAALIFGIDECRKFLMRRNIEGTLSTETNY